MENLNRRGAPVPPQYVKPHVESRKDKPFEEIALPAGGPDPDELHRIYEWCGDDMDKLKALAHLQREYTPEELLEFDLGQHIDSPHGAFEAWLSENMQPREFDKWMDDESAQKKSRYRSYPGWLKIQPAAAQTASLASLKEWVNLKLREWRRLKGREWRNLQAEELRPKVEALRKYWLDAGAQGTPGVSPSTAQVALKKWTDAGLLISLRVDPSHTPSREALCASLADPACTIRRLELFSDEKMLHFEQLQEAIRLNQSVTQVSLCCVISAHESHDFRTFLMNLLDTAVEQLELHYCVAPFMDAALTTLIESGKLKTLVIDDMPQGIAAAIELIRSAKKCQLRELSLKITDEAFGATLAEMLHPCVGYLSPEDREEETIQMSTIGGRLSDLLLNNRSIEVLNISPHLLLAGQTANLGIPPLHSRLEPGLQENHCLQEIRFHPVNSCTEEEFHAMPETQAFWNFTRAYLERNKREHRERLPHSRV